MQPPSIQIIGLSPRVRGNLGQEASIPLINRSIPACAGEPSRATSAWAAPSVYPRVCGGTDYYKRVCESLGGLSPRVRGNQVSVATEQTSGRSIPACAGEPTRPSTQHYQRWVYPRVCGGTSVAALSGLSMNGLSPRVRGNLESRSRVCQHQRSIPACAGEPS